MPQIDISQTKGATIRSASGEVPTEACSDKSAVCKGCCMLNENKGASGSIASGRGRENID